MSTPDKIEQGDKFLSYFADCIGAVDGSLVQAWVHSKDQAPWRSRKGTISQNVLETCNFEMNFVYVLAEWEGSAHDSRVLANARIRDFHVPAGKYYVVDGGYSNSDLTLPAFDITFVSRHKLYNGLRMQRNCLISIMLLFGM
jgi:DDE superfamily endonuclease